MISPLFCCQQSAHPSAAARPARPAAVRPATRLEIHESENLGILKSRLMTGQGPWVPRPTPLWTKMENVGREKIDQRGTLVGEKSDQHGQGRATWGRSPAPWDQNGKCWSGKYPTNVGRAGPLRPQPNPIGCKWRTLVGEISDQR